MAFLIRFQPLYRRGRIRVIVLVIERQIANFYLLKRKIFWCHLRDCTCQLAIERIAAKAADDDGYLNLVHNDLLEI